MWALARRAAEAAVRGTRRVVVVRTEGVMGQCLATAHCQTLQLLLISVLIISKYYKAHLVGCTKFKIQMVGTAHTTILSTSCPLESAGLPSDSPLLSSHFWWNLTVSLVIFRRTVHWKSPSDSLVRQACTGQSPDNSSQSRAKKLAFWIGRVRRSPTGKRGAV